MVADEFFDEPEQQSIIKTKLVAKYFGAWARIMLRKSRTPGGPIAYIDLFSGPGVFKDGKPSTPLWVLRHAIEDPRLCQRLITVFNDKSSDYVTRLSDAIQSLPGIESLQRAPVVLNLEVGSEVVEALRREGAEGIPSLYFIDPWGYKGLSRDLIGGGNRRLGVRLHILFQLQPYQRRAKQPASRRAYKRPIRSRACQSAPQCCSRAPSRRAAVDDYRRAHRGVKRGRRQICSALRV